MARATSKTRARSNTHRYGYVQVNSGRRIPDLTFRNDKKMYADDVEYWEKKYRQLKEKDGELKEKITYAKTMLGICRNNKKCASNRRYTDIIDGDVYTSGIGYSLNGKKSRRTSTRRY